VRAKAASNRYKNTIVNTWHDFVKITLIHYQFNDNDSLLMSQTIEKLKFYAFFIIIAGRERIQENLSSTGFQPH